MSIAAAAAGEPARAWWEFVLLVMGAVLTVFAFCGVVLRVARPHIDRYLKNLVKPMSEQLEDVHSSVHGLELSDQVTDLAHQVGRANRQLTQVDGRGRMVEGLLRQHIDESRVVLRVLDDQGIRIEPDDGH